MKNLAWFRSGENTSKVCQTFSLCLAEGRPLQPKREGSLVDGNVGPPAASVRPDIGWTRLKLISTSSTQAYKRRDEM